jgi:periplasmic divalent cation tolerance protein
MEALLVITNLPDAASAQALARHVIAERLAGCVNILAPCQIGRASCRERVS